MFGTRSKIGLPTLIVDAYSAMITVAPTTEEAIKWQEKGFALADSLRLTPSRLRILLSTGIRLGELGALQLGTKYLEKSLMFARQDKQDIFVYYILNALASFYLKNGLASKALGIAKDIQPFFLTLSSKSELIDLYQTLSDAYSAINKPDSALHYLHQMLDLKKEQDANNQLKATLKTYLEMQYKQQQMIRTILVLVK